MLLVFSEEEATKSTYAFAELTYPVTASVCIVEQTKEDVLSLIDDTLAEVILDVVIYPSEAVCIVEQMIEDTATCPDNMYSDFRVYVLTYPALSVCIVEHIMLLVLMLEVARLGTYTF